MILTQFAGVGTVTLVIDGKPYEADSVVIDLDHATQTRVRIRGLKKKRTKKRKAQKR